MRKITTAFAAALAAAVIAPVANAQATIDDTATATAQPVEEDNEFPWGLLGLAGLLGLLGRKRDDRPEVRRT